MGLLKQAAQPTEPPVEEAPVPEEEVPALSGPETPTVEDGEPPTPEEQQSYDDAMRLLYETLYADDGTSKATLGLLQPSAKIDSVAKAAGLLVSQIDKKLNVEVGIIPQLVLNIVDELMEIGTRAKDMQFSEADAKAAFGAAFELVIQSYGINPQDAQAIMAQLSEEQTNAAQTEYKAALDGAPAESGAEGVAPEQTPNVPVPGTPPGPTGAPVNG